MNLKIFFSIFKPRYVFRVLTNDCNRCNIIFRCRLESLRMLLIGQTWLQFHIESEYTRWKCTLKPMPKRLYYIWSVNDGDMIRAVHYIFGTINIKGIIWKAAHFFSKSVTWKAVILLFLYYGDYFSRARTHTNAGNHKRWRIWPLLMANFFRAVSISLKKSMWKKSVIVLSRIILFSSNSA